MLALLGEEESCLAGRLVVPEWAGWFAEVMLGRRVLAERRPGEEGAADLAFASLVEPLVSAGRVQLAVRLRALAAGEGEIRFDPEHLAGQLCEPLRAGLHRMLVRTLVRELHNARRAGELRGDDGEQRFASFVAGLQRSAWRRRELFARYPVLAQQLAAEVEGWLAASERFAAHLAADAAMVERKLAGGNALGAVVRVQPGLGDRHRGGATVTLVDWADGTQTVYKPRPMQVDAHFWRLLGWVNDRGLSPALRVMGCLDRGDHGWMEYVAAAPCPDGAARRRFYRRQGALLALVRLLSS